MYSNLGIIIVAAGSSSRFGKTNKLLTKVHDIPIFLYSLLNFRSFVPDDKIVLVCNPQLIAKFKQITKKYIPNNSFIFTEGGSERFHSVIYGLNALPSKTKFIAVHDAARPLADSDLLKKCLISCKLNGSGVAAKKITNTIKLADKNNKVIKTVDRTNLWTIETPQVFLFQELVTAYKKILKNNVIVTDDAGAIEHLGKPVFLIENHKINIKVTYPEDLTIIRNMISKISLKAMARLR